MNVLAYLFLNVPAMVVAGFAAYLCWADKSGWGWFLVVAALLVSGIKVTKNSPNDTKEIG